MRKITGGCTWISYWEISIYDEIPDLNKQSIYIDRIPYDKDMNIQGIVINTFRAYHDSVVKEKRREENIMRFLNMQEIDSSDWRTES